jgi:hypothetical protein
MNIYAFYSHSTQINIVNYDLISPVLFYGMRVLKLIVTAFIKDDKQSLAVC